MNLKKFLDEGKISPHTSSKDEICQLLSVVQRDLSDAAVTAISEDRRHATAYNAALQLGTIVLYASGYRAKSKVGHHWVTLRLIPELMGKEWANMARYFNSCREVRNMIDYESVGVIEEKAVKELIKEVEKFKTAVLFWLKIQHPKFIH